MVNLLYIVKVVSKQSARGDTGFGTRSKMQNVRERENVAEILLNKKGSGLGDFKNLHLPQVVKKY